MSGCGLISLIVTTYNSEQPLGAVLRGLSRQTDRRFEVIVADDGSGPATAAVVRAWSSRIDPPVAVVHIWQPDCGFRLAEIRNRAILASRGSYCVFLDGDCIPRPDFVAAHRRLAEPGWFVAGSRILLSRTLTASVLDCGLEPETWRIGALARRAARGEINRVWPILRLPLGPLRKVALRHARGCNLAVWRSDLDAIDGFDAAYVGWGREDDDIVVRLKRSGARQKSGRFATGVLHLWHPQSGGSKLTANDALLDAARNAIGVRASRGISALRADAARVAGRSVLAEAEPVGGVA